MTDTNPLSISSKLDKVLNAKENANVIQGSRNNHTVISVLKVKKTKKDEVLYAFGWNVKRYDYFGKQVIVFFKKVNKSNMKLLQPSIPRPLFS